MRGRPATLPERVTRKGIATMATVGSSLTVNTIVEFVGVAAHYGSRCYFRSGDLRVAGAPIDGEVLLYCEVCDDLMTVPVAAVRPV